MWTKYFLHGFAFSILFSIFGFFLAILLVFLMAIGSIIGLIVGIVVLILAMGALNGFLSGYIWDFDTNSSFGSLLLHGLALLVLLFVVNITITLVVSSILPWLVAFVAIFVLECFADGYVAKNVATWFSFGGEAGRAQYTGGERYLKRVYREDYRCGNCFWFGKPGCERNEEWINAKPCGDYKRKYYD